MNIYIRNAHEDQSDLLAENVKTKEEVLQIYEELRKNYFVLRRRKLRSGDWQFVIMRDQK